MFDRFDICDAYYMFATLYHGGQTSQEYAYFGRLQKIGYRPGLSTRSGEPHMLDENARIIFDALVSRYESGLHP